MLAIFTESENPPQLPKLRVAGSSPVSRSKINYLHVSVSVWFQTDVPVCYQNPSGAGRTQLLRRVPPNVAVVKTTHTGQSDDMGVRRRPILRRPTRRRVPQLRVDALSVVVDDVVAEQAPQMLLVEHDHVIQQLPEGAALNGRADG